MEITHSAAIQIITDDQKASDTLFKRCVVRRDDDKFMFRRLIFRWNTHEKAEKVIQAKKKTNTCQKFTNSLLLNFVMTKDLRRLFEFRCCATSKTFAFMNEVLRSVTPQKTIERIKNECANVSGDYRLLETRFRIKIRAICRSIGLVVE